MPLYDYRCHKCGETFEVRQSFSEEPLQTHEGCGGTVERLISVPALQFKGTGWYVTDYGRGSSKPAGNGSAGSPASTPAKTESKPAAKPDAPKSSSSDK